MAQLVERSLPIPEVGCTISASGKMLFTVNCIEKTKIKKKEAGNDPFKKSETKIIAVIKDIDLSYFVKNHLNDQNNIVYVVQNSLV